METLKNDLRTVVLPEHPFRNIPCTEIHMLMPMSIWLNAPSNTNRRPHFQELPVQHQPSGPRAYTPCSALRAPNQARGSSLRSVGLAQCQSLRGAPWPSGAGRQTRARRRGNYVCILRLSASRQGPAAVPVPGERHRDRQSPRDMANA